MKSILILGAGLSSSSLIRYLLHQSEEHNWSIKIVDRDIDQVKGKIGNHPNAEALEFDALNSNERRIWIQKSSLVISMLPARFHFEIARDCVDLGVHLITPSYVTKEIKNLHNEAKSKGIILMNEIGVDPGIDHMSAMRVIDKIIDLGGVLTSFKSFCGGLVAQEFDTIPGIINSHGIRGMLCLLAKVELQPLFIMENTSLFHTIACLTDWIELN